MRVQLPGLGFPRYRINQFDKYRISFDLTRLISKWSSYNSISRSINQINSILIDIEIDQFISMSRLIEIYFNLVSNEIELKFDLNQ